MNIVEIKEIKYAGPRPALIFWTTNCHDDNVNGYGTSAFPSLCSVAVIAAAC